MILFDYCTFFLLSYDFLQVPGVVQDWLPLLVLKALELLDLERGGAQGCLKILNLRARIRTCCVLMLKTSLATAQLTVLRQGG